jgi:hypothetical protein
MDVKQTTILCRRREGQKIKMSDTGRNIVSGLMGLHSHQYRISVYSNIKSEGKPELPYTLYNTASANILASISYRRQA